MDTQEDRQRNPSLHMQSMVCGDTKALTVILELQVVTHDWGLTDLFHSQSRKS